MENKMLDDPNRKYVPKKEFITPKRRYTFKRNAQPSLRRLCKLYLIALLEKPEHNAAR